jgi:GTP-binding protein
MSVYPLVRFLFSAAAATQFPPDSGSEVAIAGRSNAGKSSAINAIVGRKSLARTSKTPGRTRLLNFFELSPGARLIDLPGYGYAAGPREDRLGWGRLIEALAPRQSLKGLMLVVDSRRGILAADEQLLLWAQQIGQPVHVLFAKSDQIKRAEGQRLLDAGIAARHHATAQLFSAHGGTGIEQARAQMDAWLGLGPPKKKAPAVPE